MRLMEQETMRRVLLQKTFTRKSPVEDSTLPPETRRRRTTKHFKVAENCQKLQRKSPRHQPPQMADLSNKPEDSLIRTREADHSIQNCSAQNGRHQSTTASSQTTIATTQERSASSASSPRCRTRSQSRRDSKNMDINDFKTLWLRAEETLGASIEDLEKHSTFRSANTLMKSHDSEFQRTAQYGRVESKACFAVLKHLELTAAIDTFLDIGHGIGNIVLMASYLFKCHSRGIEVVRDRHQVAVKFQRAMEAARLNLEREQNINFDLVGSIDLRPGRLEDPRNFDFLTQPSRGEGRMKVFCNNFGAVFSDKSAKASHKYFLDDYIAGLFAIMPPGSIIITFSRLTFPATRSQIIKQRKDIEETGFYELEEINLGPAKDAVSWASGSNIRDLIAYKYTRVGPSSYICWKCGETQSAAKKLPTGEMVQNYCKCPDNVSCLRQRPKKKHRMSI